MLPLLFDLYGWPKVWLKIVTLKHCLFVATNIGKDNDKGKYVYSSYGTGFDGNAGGKFGQLYLECCNFSFWS